MDLSQDVLLPILFVTIAANAAIILVLLASGRIGRNKRMAATGAHPAAFEETIMSSSYTDRSAADAWAPPSAGAPLPEDAGGVVAALGPAASEPEPAPLAPSTETPAVEDGIDALTGLADAAAFHRLIADEDARIARYRHPATVVIFELDGLDRFVERLGQEAGDRILPPVADTIRRLARGADHVARVGPGRFAALLPETDEVAAINYVERVRRASELWLDAGAIALRLAIGWAGTSGDPSLADAQRLATDRMYAELRRSARRTVDDPAPAEANEPG